jgi:hypothetical protein
VRCLNVRRYLKGQLASPVLWACLRGCEGNLNAMWKHL